MCVMCQLYAPSPCWANPDLDLACVFIPNGFCRRDTLTERCQVLSDAVRQACR